MGIADFYWTQLLEFPLEFINARFPEWVVFSYKVIVSIVLVLLLAGLARMVLGLFKRRKRQELFDDESYLSQTVAAPGGDGAFQLSLDAAHHLQATVKPLIARKEYARVGEVYASLKRWNDAAKWFKKSGDCMRAAENWARAGKTAKAAKLLLKAGDHATAGRFFSETGRHAQAAKAYEEGGLFAAAAGAYAAAGKYREAAMTYAFYFEKADEPAEARIRHADTCYKLLDTNKAREAIPTEVRTKLFLALADLFQAAKHFGLAAHLFREAGNLGRAGEVYLHAGKLDEAAQCMREAGNDQRANQILGRLYEKQERFGDAGAAYAQGQDYRRAAACYARINDMLHAAQCYEKGAEFYNAGVAYMRAKNYEAAVRAFKQMPEGAPDFDDSRLLIGRCYYTLGDYELCAAALENQLSSRVAQKNVEYFKMLADVYDKLNKSEDALSILRKVKIVTADSEEIDSRITSVQSSIEKQKISAQATQASRAGSGAVNREMTRVESALDQRFRFEKELGRGGMGVVYLAHDTKLDRKVALKFLGSYVDDSEEFRQRFVREAQSAAKVNHANVVAIYDIGADEGKAYIAMEFIDGTSLKRLIREKGKLPPKQAINIVGQACLALQAIHNAGLIHRDIKPDNILIARNGRVKMTDFGLARGQVADITKAEQVIGTPSYMAPEQVRGDKLDPRTDIYAMGLVLHEALTGAAYFAEGDSMGRQLEEMPPAPGETTEGIPETLDEVVMRCLAKHPDERFQTAAELTQALRALT
ncbi:MAG TPA: serine/threonine protein kinase [Candidatus Hydrogenedentes bacterium]|nr:serine/threonine protein kinase [Candidatus Hydrogenedentota bacterium]